MDYAKTPYNFVPMSDRVINGKDDLPTTAACFHEDRHTGWFDVRLEALTPIYTRGVKELGADRSDLEPEFFQYPDGRYALPGSGLRGMTRSLFEIMTYSRLEFVSKRRLFYRSFAAAQGNLRQHYTRRFGSLNGAPNVRGGVLEGEEGERRLVVSSDVPKGFVVVRASDPVAQREMPSRDPRLERGNFWLPLGERTDDPAASHPWTVVVGADTLERVGARIATLQKTGGTSGWLIVPGVDVPRSGGVQRSWFQFILLPPNDPNRREVYPVPEDVYRDYLAWGAMAHGSRFGKAQDESRKKDESVEEPMKAPRRLEEGHPAFAVVNPATGEVEVLGATMMMHMRYPASIEDVAKRSLAADAKNVDVDMAQAVFGRVREGKSEELTRPFDLIRGRVFFEDAVCEQRGADALFDPSSPDRYVLLSSPKPTAFQTYLTQKNPDRLATYEESGATLAGRKLYWHRSERAVREELKTRKEDAGGESQATQLRPLRAGVTFRGRIRFENLTPAELGALYASLQLPDGLAHKFGMGKSLGLGSMRLTVTETVLLDFQKRLRSLDPEAGWKTGAATEEDLSKAYTAFVKRLSPKATSLWTNARMQALAALLSWAGKPSDAETTHAEMRDNQWRYRWTLRSPQQTAPVIGVVDVLPVGEAASVSSSQPTTEVSETEPPARADNRTPQADDSRSAHEQRQAPASIQRRSIEPTRLPSSPPKQAPKQAPKQGDKVNGVVQEKDAAGNGKVLLTDGTVAKGTGLHSHVVGQSYPYKVRRVGGDGLVKEVSP
jgi:CRISPR-associated protein (TIGR03986 family)